MGSDSWPTWSFFPTIVMQALAVSVTSFSPSAVFGYISTSLVIAQLLQCVDSILTVRNHIGVENWFTDTIRTIPCSNCSIGEVWVSLKLSLELTKVLLIIILLQNFYLVKFSTECLPLCLSNATGVTIVEAMNLIFTIIDVTSAKFGHFGIPQYI